MAREMRVCSLRKKKRFRISIIFLQKLIKTVLQGELLGLIFSLSGKQVKIMHQNKM